MDFFSAQEAARRKTGLLVFYFFLAVLMIILATYAASITAFVGVVHKGSVQRLDPALFWQPELFLFPQRTVQFLQKDLPQVMKHFWILEKII